MNDKPVILVLCTGNSARSQMAEAFLRKYKGDRTANSLFTIGDHAFDRHLPWLEQLLDFREEGGQISLRTAE